jgi:hypothetical protein
MDQEIIRWSMELSNQEGYKSPSEVLKAYKGEI